MSLYNTGPQKNELLERLRHELNLTEADATDEDVLEKTKGSFTVARIELGISLSQLIQSLKAAIGLKY